MPAGKFLDWNSEPLAYHAPLKLKRKEAIFLCLEKMCLYIWPRLQRPWLAEQAIELSDRLAHRSRFFNDVLRHVVEKSFKRIEVRRQRPTHSFVELGAGLGLPCGLPPLTG